MDLTVLTDYYSYFLLGMPIGIALITLFFIFGSTISLLYGVMSRS